MDPLVREDGALEPALELTSEAPSPEPDSRTQAPESAAEPEATHPVRERLLARAAAQEAPPTTPQSALWDELDAIGRGEDPHPLDEAAAVRPDGAPRAPSAPLPPRTHSQLSPTLIAVFGTLMGVATVVSLVALMINIDRRHAASKPEPKPAPIVSAAAVAPAPAPTVSKPPRQKIPGPWRIEDQKGDPALRVVEGKIGSEPFIRAVTGAGLQKHEAYRVIVAMKGVRDLDKCGKTDRFIALVERSSGRIKAFEYVVGPEEIYQAREDSDNLLKGIKLDLKMERNQVSGSLVYDGKSFEASARSAGFDPGLSHVVARALEGHVGMDELERGDRLRIVAQEVSVLGEFARYSGVEALELVRADTKQPTLRVYYFDDDKLRGYYDRSGKAPYAGGWRKPIKDAAVTSPFNLKRFHPILKKIVPHLGTDFGAPIGTPVAASSYGTVSFVGPAGASGNLVKIKHPGGIETGYAHLSRYAEGLKVGDKVKRLQVIGYVGSTGRSTGPHLHFSAERDGKFFDAETLDLDGMRTLTHEEHDQFSEVMSKYDPLLDAIVLPAPLAPEPSANSNAPAAAPSSSSAEPEFAEPNPGAAADEANEAEPLGAHAPEPSAHTPAGPAPRASANAVYLSDKDLLKLQGSSDDGEVE